MNNPNSENSSSAVALFGRVICSILPIPLFSFGWPSAIVFGRDLMRTTGSTYRGGGGDLGDLIAVTWNIGVGLFIGIQLGANLFRRLQNIRVFRDSLQVTITVLLTLFSAFCLVGTIGFDGGSVIAFANDDSRHQILDLIVVAFTFTPVFGWFLVNFLRLVRKDYLLGRFLSS